MSRHLADDGCFWANVNTRGSEGKWLEFPFVRRPLGFYEGLAGESGLEMRALGTIGELGFRLDSPERENVLLAFTKRSTSTARPDTIVR